MRDEREREVREMRDRNNGHQHEDTKIYTYHFLIEIYKHNTYYLHKPL